MSAAAVLFHGATGVYIEFIENGILDLNVNFKKDNKANCFCFRDHEMKKLIRGLL